MHLQSIILGKDDSMVAAVDPLVDFADECGVFAQCYGLNDTERVREICSRVSQETLRLRGQAYQVLFRSKYTYGQFSVKGLERLCTTTMGREPVVPAKYFDLVFDKYDNSILSAGAEVEALIDQRSFIIFEGVTTTSCIGISIDDTRKRFKGKKIIIPRDLVASRHERSAYEERMLDEFSRDGSRDVHIVERMSDIEFVG